MIKRLLILVLLLLLSTGCDDPKRIAEANAIRRQSEASYLATATAVAVQANATATAVADIEHVREATRDERIAREETLIQWSTIALVAIILTLSIAVSISSIGTATAYTYWVGQHARLIWIDRATRTWPIMLDIQTGRLIDLETGERARIDDIQPLDHRRLILSGQVRTTGLLADAAQKMARLTRDGSAGSALPAIAHSVPTLSDASPEQHGSDQQTTATP